MKIPKNYAHLAVESTARRMIDYMEGEREQRSVDLDQAEGLSALEQGAVEGFFEHAQGHEGINNVPGVQFDELKTTLKALHQELKAVDIDSDGIDDTERAQMSKAGQLAMALAEEMMAQEPIAAMTAQQFEGLTPEETVATIRQAATDHVELGYNVARAIMFAHIDNRDGQVDGIYDGEELKDVVGMPSSSIMNTEHVWPKSRGVKDTPAVSDLHHLFPADQEINTRRSSYPFGIVEEVKWEEGEARLGYGKDGHVVFEPPKEERGNIARALFYVATVYDLKLMEGEPELLLRWNQEDPVDAAERQRNDEISRYQRNRNPFVDQPDLADALIATMETQSIPAFMQAKDK